MTDLGRRIVALGDPVADIAEESGVVTRGHLSNVMYGRRRLSPKALARVEAVLSRLESERARTAAALAVGRLALEETTHAA